MAFGEGHTESYVCTESRWGRPPPTLSKRPLDQQIDYINMSSEEEVGVGSEVLVCGGSYPGAFGVITRKTPKRFEIQRTDGSVIQVAQHNVKLANRSSNSARQEGLLEERVERQMDVVQRELTELNKLMKALLVEKKKKKK